MGKSPAKWIKTVLFGKKSSKSNMSKDGIIERKAEFAAKTVSGDLGMNPPSISDPFPQMFGRSGGITESEHDATADLPYEAGLVLPEEQSSDTIAATKSNSVNNADITKQWQSAIRVQTVFRGYLARRAFRALKGIIRLQALVRGHLVRRQAIATLHCMQGIIKFQARARGRSVRLSVENCEVLKKCSPTESLVVKQVETCGGTTPVKSERLVTNAFVIKLLGSSPTAMPLSLQYDLDEPNSVHNWLERWSSTRFWEPLTQTKKVCEIKPPQRKQANMRGEEIEAGQPKRSVRKFPMSNGDNYLLHSSESEKSKRSARKHLSHQQEPVQEPQNELERVKRNLRKVSLSAALGTDRSEAVIEKPQHDSIKLPSSSLRDVSQGIDNPPEKTSESTVAVSEQLVAEAPQPLLVEDGTLDMLLDDQPTVELHSSECKVENSISIDEKLSYDEDQTSKENQRPRRKSFSAKQEFPENVSQNTPTLPSYMAATESAKAKSRAQGSPRLAEDDGDENGLIRRHSLPSSINGKLSSPAPRIQKPILANGKAGSKSNRLLTSSRDDKMLQPGWRR